MGEERFEIFGYEASKFTTAMIFITITIFVISCIRIVYDLTPAPKYVPESCILIIIGLIIGGITASFNTTQS